MLKRSRSLSTEKNQSLFLFFGFLQFLKQQWEKETGVYLAVN